MRTSSAGLLLLALSLVPVASRADEPIWRAALTATPMEAEERQTLLTLYDSRGKLLWIQNDQLSAQARAVGQVLAQADQKGLDPADYGMPSLGARIADSSPRTPEENAALDVAISKAALELLGDLGRGRIDPRAVHWQLGAARPTPALAEQLTELTDTPDVLAAIDRAETPLAVYRRTSKALRDYLALEARGDGPALPAWKSTIHEGDSPAGLDALAARLQLLGDLPPGVVNSLRYEGTLVTAVKSFQRRHGLKEDGDIDRLTARAFAVPLAVRVQQLALALERMRWLPRSLAPPLIVVNIPEFVLRAVSPPGVPSLEMKVVVGRAYHHRTPIFVTEVEAVQFHPFWNVPKDIALRELLPRYVARHAVGAGFELVDAQGHVQPGAVTSEDERRVSAGSLRLRQLPGAQNALGPLKLEMPDRYEVYLHGTPSPERFEQARRDFSHGCIRLEDPSALAVWALARTPGWDEARVRAAVATDVAVRAPLAEPIPVLILYSTAVVPEDGSVRFFGDLYGHDTLLEKALAHLSAARHARGALASSAGDVNPQEGP